MKRTLLGMVMMLVMVSVTWAGQQMSVQVRKASVKAGPTFMSRTVGTVSYGDSLAVGAEQNNWAHVERPAGWIHRSALTTRDVRDMSTAYAGGNVSKDEAALAGKGFNPRVEQQYRRQNRSLAKAYGDVDRVETFTASDAALRRFAKDGGLTL